MLIYNIFCNISTMTIKVSYQNKNSFLLLLSTNIHKANINITFLAMF